MAERCAHFAGLAPAEPRASGCEECLAIGSTWTELRVCLTCGHVGCCEDSKHAHALRHFRDTGHPIIAPLEPSPTWTWCYIDRNYYAPLPAAGRPARRGGLGGLFARLVGR
jgi:uncharacterized UBP type Zn finger protein